MAEFGPDLKDAVADVCRANAEEIGAVLSRALDQTFTIEVGEPRTMEWGEWAETWKDAGLALTLDIEGQFAVLVLPHGDGLVPAWCPAPDPTGQSKLETLALELGMNVLPDEFMPLDSRAAYSPNLADALALASGETLALIPWVVQAGDVSGEAALLLPIQDGLKLFDLKAEPAAEATKPTAAATSGPTSDSVANPINLVGDEPDIDMSVYETPHERLEHELHLLPPYVRSLLRVKVKVSVCLASTRTKLSRVVDIGPGSIIQFDKNCEAPLTVEVAGIEVAQGEAVKIGDKFGLRVESIVLPPERFAAMPKRRSA